MSTPEAKPFPCPFCGSSRVTLVGGGLVFLHYECRECAEVWTAMAMPTQIRRPASADPTQPQLSAQEKPRKIWLN